MEAEIQCAEIEAPYEILAPVRQTLPLVFASPHSGSRYPEDFVTGSRLGRLNLRRSEDCFVDDLFGAAPRLGAPLIRALFPRAYVDVNREPFELDPAMFADALPSYANTRSPRVASGLGTIARVVASGSDIYRHKLRFDEALERIRQFYWPYHNALRELIESTRRRFGYCILVDCHSMPSVGGPIDRDPGSRRVDFVLGDRHGTSCAATVTEAAARILEARDFVVTRNAPYSGGFVTRHYGRPSSAVHALQVEINRVLYMDELHYRRAAGFDALATQLGDLIEALGGLDPTPLTRV